MLDEISAFFENYGWYFFFASILFAYVFMKYLKPAIENFRQERYLTQIKKFDKNVSEKYGDKMKEAREKQYQQYLAEAAREQERAAEKRRLREEKDKEESFAETEKRRLREEKDKEESFAESNNGGNSLNSSKSFDPVDDPESYVLNKISTKKVLIFSKRSCPFCVKAKQALSSFRLTNDDYEVIELDDFVGKVGQKIQNVLQQITGVHSVPRVFINEQCIGGGDDTVTALRDGRLERWLREANAI
uniref:Glutaredoxin domain-containing protein n=1 Tax=Panagrolaimus sp. ES5 TaxID=591445 RepID=A0AC34GRA7_9BILA